MPFWCLLVHPLTFNWRSHETPQRFAVDLGLGMRLERGTRLLATVAGRKVFLGDGLYGVNSALIVRVANGSAGRFVGQELDAQAV